MKGSLIGLLFFFSFCTLCECQNKETHRDRFHRFIKQFKKTYKYGSKTYEERFKAFRYNLHMQEKLNAKRNHNSSAKYGTTKFSDLTPEEFKAKYLSSLHRSPVRHPLLMKTVSNMNLVVKMANLPSKIDWRKRNVLGPIRNQKACGGCWAFSVVEATEAMYTIRTNGSRRVALSVQEVIDCSKAFEGALWGCKGGQICAALEWLKQEHIPLVPSTTYPLTDKSEDCNLDLNFTHPGVHVTYYKCDHLVGQEYTIQSHLLRGPVAVSIDATSWNNYIGGIIQFHCGGLPNNHAVIIVGYDTTGDIPYYIVMNSWGSDFGDGGFLYIRMGANLCGIAEEVSVVDVAV